MREAMARAEVGDDVFGDEPTVTRLEARVAEILGKEAAVFTPSGTMANQLALRAQTESGDEILVDGNALIYYYEAGGPAALAGVMCRCLPGVRGVFTAADVETALRPVDPHYSPTKLVCLENTHNRGGGAVWPMERIRDVARVAREHRLRLHLDGARLWNVTVATGIPEREYAAPFDSVSVCFSKGLGAPIGSVEPINHRQRPFALLREIPGIGRKRLATILPSRHSGHRETHGRSRLSHWLGCAPAIPIARRQHFTGAGSPAR